jgi:cytochrome c oxidase cbb3-type subunit 3
VGNFSEGFWDLFIVVCTVGGIFALFVFVATFAGSTGAGEAETMGHTWDEDLEEYNNPLPGWWNVMFYVTLAFGVLYLLLYPGLGSNSMLLSWTQIKQYEAEMARAEQTYGPLYQRYVGMDLAAVDADSDGRKMGRRLYLNYCAQCHGSDAGGARGFPNLTDDDWLYGGAPEQIKASIMQGRNGVMPAWLEPLGGEAGVKDMAQHVLRLAGRDHDAGSAERAAPQFAQRCAACHGPDGTGNQQLGAPNLTNDVWLYGGSVGAIEHTLANGRNGQMPAHGEFLGEAKSHVVAAYVYGLSTTTAQPAQQ